MPIINLMNQTVRLADENDEVYATFDPDDASLHLETTGDEQIVDGVPIDVTRIVSVGGLPAPQEGTFYIVPQPVAHASNRPDLVTPDTGPGAIRDENGAVYAVRRLFSVTMDEERAPATPS